MSCLYCFSSKLHSNMRSYCRGGDDLLCIKHRKSSKIPYTKEIIIFGLTEEIILEELYIRFSIYGNIKDCNWFPNSKKDKQARIIFCEAYSAMLVSLDQEIIYLHGKKLKVHLANSKDTKKLQLHLENHGGNTISINELTKNCLLEIFKYLSIMERLNLRKVCRRFYKIANESLSMLQDVDLVIHSEDLMHIPHLNYEKQLLKLFRDVEKQQLQAETSFLYYKHHNPLNLIASLHFHLLLVDCTKLTKLIISCSTYDEQILIRIFESNKELKHIEIYCNPYIIGESFSYLPESMHTLIVYDCNNLKYNHLCDALKRFKDLKHLKLIDIKNYDIADIFNKQYDISNIFNEHCKNLEVLSLPCNASFYPRDYYVKYLTITSLKNLRRLIIKDTAHVSDEFLVNLCSNCQELRYLRIHHRASDMNIWKMSDRAMNAINSLQKLKAFDIECKEINYSKLCCNLDLEIVVAYTRVEEQVEQLLTLIRNSPKLKYLDISRCYEYKEKILANTKIISTYRDDMILEIVTTEKRNEPEKHLIYSQTSQKDVLKPS